MYTITFVVHYYKNILNITIIFYFIFLKSSSRKQNEIMYQKETI